MGILFQNSSISKITSVKTSRAPGPLPSPLGHRGPEKETARLLLPLFPSWRTWTGKGRCSGHVGTLLGAADLESFACINSSLCRKPSLEKYTVMTSIFSIAIQTRLRPALEHLVTAAQQRQIQLSPSQPYWTAPKPLHHFT